jgi:hypothetical protein
MAKALTITGMVVATLMLVLFGLDLATGFPFARPNTLIDICFLISGGLLLYCSWTTYRELE